MRQPSITIVQRGRADRFGMQKLYLRYSWNYHTNYIALPWKVLPKDWDGRAQSVKPKAILGGEGAVVVNTDLRNKLNKAFLIATELTAANIAPSFEVFRQKFDGNRKQFSSFAATAEEILKKELAAREVTPSTFKAYRAAIRKFVDKVGDLSVQQITRDKVLQFKSKMVAIGKENMSAQYLRNFKVVYNKVLKFHRLKDLHSPFEDLEFKVERISNKKKLTVEEYTILRKALPTFPEGSDGHETIRRFLIMCRGLRYSDTEQINRHAHFFEMQDGETTYRYLLKSAQKTGTQEIVPISETDAQVLLKWREDGSLFKKITYPAYVKKLKRISRELIGREITTHFGRHFTGDLILNSGVMDAEDVKKILGVTSDRIAEVYAQRDIKALLKKFYTAVEGLEGKGG
jgi:integrase